MSSFDHPDAIDVLRRRWRQAGVSVVATLLVGGSVLLGRPVLSAREELREQLALVESIHAEKGAVQTRLAAAAAEAHRWRTENELRSRRASVKHDEAGFLDWIHRQAQACRITVRDFRPTNRDTDGEYDSRGIMLSAQGNYRGIVEFLDRFRECPRMNRIVSLEISPRDAEQGLYAVTLQALLFTYAPQSPAPAKSGVAP